MHEVVGEYNTPQEVYTKESQVWSLLLSTGRTKRHQKCRGGEEEEERKSCRKTPKILLPEQDSLWQAHPVRRILHRTSSHWSHLAPNCKNLLPVMEEPCIILKKTSKVNYEINHSVWPLWRSTDIVHMIKLGKYSNATDFRLGRGEVVSREDDDDAEEGVT